MADSQVRQVDADFIRNALNAEHRCKWKLGTDHIRCYFCSAPAEVDGEGRVASLYDKEDWGTAGYLCTECRKLVAEVLGEHTCAPTG